jgi:hypothetical protein
MDVNETMTPAASGWPKRLRRREAVEYLAEKHGIRLSEKTLRNHNVLGTGPDHEYFGSWWLTRPEWMDKWAKGRMRKTPANRGHKGADPTVAKHDTGRCVTDLEPAPARNRHVSTTVVVGRAS